MVADYLSSLGLIFGMIGAWLLYKSFPPGLDRIGVQANDVAGAKKQRWINPRSGFLVLLLGFLLQLVAMWIPF